MAAFFFFAACTQQPAKPNVPALTPQAAGTLLQLNAQAKNWLTHAKQQNAACEYRIELPDQSNHPKVIDVGHAMVCGTLPAPLSLNASVTFVWDESAGHWIISRFSS